MCINQADTLLGGLRGDQHDHLQVIPIGDRFIVGHVVGIGQVGDDHAIHTHLHTALAEGLEAILHDGVQIAHQDDRDLYRLSDLFQLLEEQANRHTVAQGHGARLLDHRAIGHRIGEGNTYLHHVHTFRLQFPQDGSRIVQLGIACREIDGEYARFLCLK